MIDSQPRPRFEHQWLSLQWHSGFVGMGSGWDQKMVAQINMLGENGFQMVSAVQQKDPTWFILFFVRQIG